MILNKAYMTDMQLGFDKSASQSWAYLRAAVRTRLLCWSFSPLTNTMCSALKCGRRLSPIVSVSELKRMRAICTRGASIHEIALQGALTGEQRKKCF